MSTVESLSTRGVKYRSRVEMSCGRGRPKAMELVESWKMTTFSLRFSVSTDEYSVSYFLSSARVIEPLFALIWSASASFSTLTTVSRPERKRANFPNRPIDAERARRISIPFRCSAIEILPRLRFTMSAYWSWRPPTSTVPEMLSPRSVRCRPFSSMVVTRELSASTFTVPFSAMLLTSHSRSDAESESAPEDADCAAGASSVAFFCASGFSFLG